MSERLTTAWKLKKPAIAGQQLYSCTGQLLASDYVYADSFATGADAALKQVGATGVPRRSSCRRPTSPGSRRSASASSCRRCIPARSRGIHGTQMGSVVASPQGLTLQPGPPNFVKGDKNLVFVVSVEEQRQVHRGRRDGEADIEAGRAARERRSRRRQRIASVAAGQTATARFSGFFASTQGAPDYSVPYKLTVSSLKVPGEHNLTNNTSTYTVEFSISS